MAHFHFNLFIQLAVTIIGLMEQYLRNKDITNSALNATDTTFKSSVWHESSHGMRLRIAHHRMYDNDKVDKRANKAPKFARAVFTQKHANWTGLTERCWAIVKKG